MEFVSSGITKNVQREPRVIRCSISLCVDFSRNCIFVHEECCFYHINSNKIVQLLKSEISKNVAHLSFLYWMQVVIDIYVCPTEKQHILAGKNNRGLITL